MASRLVLGLALTALLAGPLTAAPAPFANPNQKGPGEVVLAAGTAGRTRLALIYLRSNHFLDSLLGSRSVQQLPCLAGVKDRRTWLASRLKVEQQPGALVRVRVGDCRLREAVTILEAAIAQVARKVPAGAGRELLIERGKRGVVLMKFQQAQLIRARIVFDGEDTAQMEEMTARYEFQGNPLQVKRPPGRAGR
jgi:hypothetical protein